MLAAGTPIMLLLVHSRRVSRSVVGRAMQEVEAEEECEEDSEYAESVADAETALRRSGCKCKEAVADTLIAELAKTSKITLVQALYLLGRYVDAA